MVRLPMLVSNSMGSLPYLFVWEAGRLNPADSPSRMHPFVPGERLRSPWARHSYPGPPPPSLDALLDWVAPSVDAPAAADVLLSAAARRRIIETLARGPAASIIRGARSATSPTKKKKWRRRWASAPASQPSRWARHATSELQVTWARSSRDTSALLKSSGGYASVLDARDKRPTRSVTRSRVIRSDDGE